MCPLQFNDLLPELSQRQFLTTLDQVAQTNYNLAWTYSDLHASGFADWHEYLRPALEIGEQISLEMLKPHIKDLELGYTFDAVWEHLDRLAMIDGQIGECLAELFGLPTIYDEQCRSELDRRVFEIVTERPGEPVAPIWVMYPEYYALGYKSWETIRAATRLKDRLDRRLEQLLSETVEDGEVEEALQPCKTYRETVKTAIGRLARSIPQNRQPVQFGSRPSYARFLQVEVVTFANLRERAQVVVDFIEHVWRTLEPFHGKLEATMWLRHQCITSRPRVFGLQPSYKKWAETCQLLLQGEVGRIWMIDWASHHSHPVRIDSNVYLNIEFGSLWGQTRGHRMSWNDPILDPREAKVLELCIDTCVWGGKISVEVQEQITNLACDLFRAVDGACGYVNIGSNWVLSTTSYERRAGMSAPSKRRLWRDVRGAFWGNLLSARHVRTLGGSQFVKQHAPCDKVIPLAEQGKNATDDVPLYLQLTQALETSTLEDYARLESFLAPILISSQGQVRIEIIHPILIASLGDVTCLKQTFADSMRRIVLLPGGALLMEYDESSRKAVQDAWKQLSGHHIAARGYRDIPQLQSLDQLNDAGVVTLEKLIKPYPKSGPIFPAILVQPCIPDDALEFRVSCADPLTSEIEEQLRKLVQEWSTLKYEVEQEMPAISACSVPQRQNNAIVWQADLAPVGQDAYIQLVMMLDEFSETIARLDEVRVGAWAK